LIVDRLSWPGEGEVVVGVSGEGEASFVDGVVVVSAQAGEVVLVCGSAVGPEDEVVDFLDGGVAVGEAAVFVAEFDG